MLELFSRPAAAMLFAVFAVGCRYAADPSAMVGPPGARIDGRTFFPRGIWAEQERDGSLRVLVFERPITCGDQDHYGRPGERNFAIVVPWWSMASAGMRTDLWNAPAAVNTQWTSREGNGGGSAAMEGGFEILAKTPTGGTIGVDARNNEGELHGQIPFTICRTI